MRGADYNYGDELVMKGWGRSDEEVPLRRPGRQGITSEDKEALKYSMTWAKVKVKLIYGDV